MGNLAPLFHLYLENKCSPEDFTEIISFLQGQDDREAIDKLILEHLSSEVNPTLRDNTLVKERLELRLQLLQHEIAVRHPGSKKPKIYSLSRWGKVAAAVIICITGTVLYFILPEKKAAKKQMGIPAVEYRYKNDIKPGKDLAVLTLSDGKKILLDSIPNGSLAQQGGVNVAKQGASIVYLGDTASNCDVLYNTIETPVGGQYTLTLTDGSKVWLNSASSIRYPTVFKGTERKVAITGEVYFEVAGNALMPFIVSTPQQTEIEVLGTQFNVNNYDDEPLAKTTLVEGSIKLRQRGNELMLESGQQAAIEPDGSMTLLRQADVESAIAWKNGFFQFNRHDIGSVMRQLSRWYDVEVTYKDHIPDRFIGTVSRNKPVSKVLTLLELTGLVHFEIQGKKITVSR